MATNIATFSAFVLMALVFGFFLWQTLFSSEEHGNRQLQAEPTYAEQHGVQEAAPGNSTTPRDAKAATDEALAEYTKWLAIFTMFLVLATIGLFISGERNVDAARRAAKAAQDSADAAKRAVELSDKTAERQLRAYVLIDALDIPNFDSNEPLKLDIGIKNSGQTPAYQVVSRTVFTGFKLPATNFMMPPIEPASRTIVPPGSIVSTHLRNQAPLTEEARRGLLDGSSAFFVFGEINYVDAFGKSRTTKFRFQSNSLSGRRPGDLIQFSATAEGNETD